MLLKSFIVFGLLALAHGQVEENPCEGINLGFVNDFSDCTRYFSCVNGYPHRGQCRDGRWFYEPGPDSTHALGCHEAGTVPCDRCPETGIVAYPIEGSCTEYILCINGNQLDRECAPGTMFDRNDRRCVLQELVDCEYERCPADGTAIVPDPSDPTCRHYLVCVDGEELERRQCSDNLLFDPALGSCARAENVQCPGARSSVNELVFEPPHKFFDIPTAPVLVPTAPTVNPRIIPANPTGVPTPPPNIIAEWPTGPVTCPPTGIHYFGHHELCTVFQVCAHGALHRVNCPPSQHWSTISGTCDFPDRANCPHWRT